MTTLTFLGTGGAMSLSRTHSTVLVGERYLLDCSPTSVAQLKRAGLRPDCVEAVFLSHFHADHTFGLPFLLLERAFKHVVERPLVVVGPPGMARYGAQLVEMAFPGIGERILAESRVKWVEVRDGADGLVRESANGPVLAWEAVSVEHCSLPSFGYRLLQNDTLLAYSGDTGLCEGLFRLADGVDALVVEMNCWERSFPGHMNREDVRSLLRRTTARRVILTHIDDEPDAQVAGAEMAAELQRVDVRAGARLAA